MYRLLIVTILFLMMPQLVTAEGSPTLQNDKIQMIIISQAGCRGCERIEEYLGYKKFKDLIATHFTVTKLHISEANKLPKGLEEPFGTPTIYFLNSKNQQIIEPMVGGKSEENFMDVLLEVIEVAKK